MLNVDRDLLVRGIAAAKAGNKDQARFFLEKFLDEDPPIEMRVEAWRYLAELSDDMADKRDYIGRILTFDSTDGGARRALAVLDGRLDPADIVNPERLTPLVSPETAAIHGERLSCPRCGSGRLVAGPDGLTLVCEHCHYEEPIVRRGDAAADENRDIAATMWTAKADGQTDRGVCLRQLRRVVLAAS
jgi:ribosomal protein S27AE